MKYVKIRFLLLCFLISCSQKDNRKDKDTNNSLPFFNTYKVFDEPGSIDVRRLKFYMLLVDFDHFGGTHIISIRQDSNIVYGCYKTATFEDVPSIQQVTDFDSIPFSYSTTHFKIETREIDTLKAWIDSYHIAALKDSVDSQHLDGGMREVFVFDGKATYHKYQTFGSSKELNSNFRSFVENVEHRYHSLIQ